MNSLRPTPKKTNSKTKTQILLAALIIAGQLVPPQVVSSLSSWARHLAGASLAEATDSVSYVYTNGYPTLNGNYIDCDGSIDNDMAHHVTNPADTDPGHHLGQNCPAGSQVNGAAIVAAPVSSAPTAAPAALSGYVYTNGYPTLNGNYIDCDGSIDNDMAHHVTNPADTDPGHHLGQNCPAGSVVNSAVNTSAPLSSTLTAVNNAPVPATAPAPQPLPTSAPASNSSIFAGQSLFRDPNSDVEHYTNTIRSTDPYNASLLDKIANQPTGFWFGDWNSNVQSDVNNVVTAAQQAGQLPVLVTYNIPQRDCGGYSSGGSSASFYQQWVRSMAAGIGHRSAVVILEPDAVALTTCLSSSDLQTRYNLLKDAVNVFKSNGQAVYIDAGHPDWISASDMASRLQQSGIGQADGFALNVSNFYTTSDNISYGQQISAALGGKHFVIDTGRNGNGSTPDAQWCNPSGRALGQRPTAATGNPLVDALLWVKGPGGSDGQCNGGPAAGIFWASYAEGLASRAAW